ncbi:MAG TPA: hypothetical protein VEZ90_18295, partial [Blastocatellia bacterium]|nr:hypothetical protein [Blastocatellia bacterium]
PFVTSFLPAFNKGFRKGFQQARAGQNEMSAMNELNSIGTAEKSFRSIVGRGRYGTIEEIERAGLIDRSQLSLMGYEFTVVADRDRFAAFAYPKLYPATGIRSFYLSSDDFTLRGGDKSGKYASSDDPPVAPNGVPGRIYEDQ